MSSLARRWLRAARRRPAPARYDLEVLEGRTLLSGAGTAAAAAASHAKISTTTTLETSLSTAVTGAKVTFTASVADADDDAPITSGKVVFLVEGPQDRVLGTAGVDRYGQAIVATDQLTAITEYQVDAEYIPVNPRVSSSVATTVAVHVIPQPLHVPTAITLQSGATSAESGQDVPLVATVKDAGTGDQVDAGKVQPLAGTVEFFVDSPHPIVLGKVAINQQDEPTSPLLSGIDSILGMMSSQAAVDRSDRAFLSTDLLKAVGRYPIEARFLPANDDFDASTSAPVAVTITPPTRRAPTATSLQAAPSTIESGEPVGLDVTVQNADSSLAGGTVELVTVAPHPIVLGRISVGVFGQQVSLSSDVLQAVGVHQVRAIYRPGSDRFAGSTSAPVTITVTPVTAASFRVTPLVRDGRLGQPLSFAVTALDAQGQPLTSYTGTVVLSSPTDSWKVLPAAAYTSLQIAEPPANSPSLATFSPGSYTFTTADRGSHTFVGAVRFGKAGAESLQVTQADDPRVSGKTTFAVE